MTVANASAPERAHGARRGTAAGAPIIPTSSDLLDAAILLAPEIRALSDQIEHIRRLPGLLVQTLAAAGHFHMAVPRSTGGAEADPITIARVVEELAKADGSVAWCVMLANQVAFSAGSLPEAGAREVFGDASAIAAAVLRPIGRAVPVEGGYRVTGHWPFASGSNHATWLAGECVVMDGDTPRRTEDGRLVTRLCFIPRAECSVLDTWEATGLRGTGSNEFSVADVFVPEQRSYQLYGAPPREHGPLYQEAALQYLGQGSQPLGVAQAALETLVELATAHGAFVSRGQLRDQLRLQAQVAEAQALLESARAYFYGAAEDLWQTASAGRPSTAAQRARVRLATSHAANAAVQAVDLVYAAAGTAAVLTRNGLDRRFRDVRTAAAHVMVGPGTYEAAGRVSLGLEAGMLFF